MSDPDDIRPGVVRDNPTRAKLQHDLFMDATTRNDRAGTERLVEVLGSEIKRRQGRS